VSRVPVIGARSADFVWRAGGAVAKAVSLGGHAEVRHTEAERAAALPTIKPLQLFLFEPHQPERCNVTPTIRVDITSVWERKTAAMAEMHAQRYLQTYYAQRGEKRGNHARRASGNAELRYAESFQRILPQVAEQL
jgi:LmbE family N-acetylglucosaminyl deacetylase